MAENVILRKSDKEILRGEKGDSDFQDFANRKSKIRTRVKNRSETLVEEIQLLQEAGETEVAEKLLETILDDSQFVTHASLKERAKQIEQTLEEIDRRCDDVPRLRDELEEIQEQLATTAHNPQYRS